MTKSAMLEADFMRQVCDTADILGWKWVHFRPARTTQGWRTPVQGPMGKGWPDLILVRGNRSLAVELKRDGRKATTEQTEVLAMLAEAGMETFVWSPEDFDTLVGVLR